MTFDTLARKTKMEVGAKLEEIRGWLDEADRNGAVDLGHGVSIRAQVGMDFPYYIHDGSSVVGVDDEVGVLLELRTFLGGP